MLSALFLMAASVAGGPTDGDIYRELATDTAAFDRADRNGDGFLSETEVARYKLIRQGAISRFGTSNLGGWDINGDSTLTPYELFTEADYRIRAPYYMHLRDWAWEDEYGEYYVDDRDGTVYRD